MPGRLDDARIGHGDVAVVVDRLLGKLHIVARPDAGFRRDVEPARRSLEHRHAQHVAHAEHQARGCPPVREDTGQPLRLVRIEDGQRAGRDRHEIIGKRRRGPVLDGTRGRACHWQAGTSGGRETEDCDQKPNATFPNQHESPSPRRKNLSSKACSMLESAEKSMHRLCLEINLKLCVAETQRRSREDVG